MNSRRKIGVMDSLDPSTFPKRTDAKLPRSATFPRGSCFGRQWPARRIATRMSVASRIATRRDRQAPGALREEYTVRLQRPEAWYPHHCSVADACALYFAGAKVPYMKDSLPVEFTPHIEIFQKHPSERELEVGSLPFQKRAGASTARASDTGRANRIPLLPRSTHSMPSLTARSSTRGRRASALRFRFWHESTKLGRLRNVSFRHSLPPRSERGSFPLMRPNRSLESTTR